MLRPFAVLCIVLVLPLVLAGCGSEEQAAEKAVEQVIEEGSGGDVDIDTEDGSVEVKDEDGTTSKMTSGEELPEDFPKEIPLPKGAKVTSGTKVSTDGNDTFVVSANVDQSFEEVAAFYEEELEGFKQEMEISTGDGASAQYAGRDWNVLLGVAKDGDGNTLSLTVTPAAAAA